jgi:hypothetical protein
MIEVTHERPDAFLTTRAEHNRSHFRDLLLRSRSAQGRLRLPPDKAQPHRYSLYIAQRATSSPIHDFEPDGDPILFYAYSCVLLEAGRLNAKATVIQPNRSGLVLTFNSEAPVCLVMHRIGRIVQQWNQRLRESPWQLLMLAD